MASAFRSLAAACHLLADKSVDRALDKNPPAVYERKDRGVVRWADGSVHLRTMVGGELPKIYRKPCRGCTLTFSQT